MVRENRKPGFVNARICSYGIKRKDKTISGLLLKKKQAKDHFRNATGGEQNILKASELFIQAADSGHSASKKSLVNLANKLMKSTLFTTSTLETLYRLSQVMDTLFSETEIENQKIYSGDVLLEKAAKMGHPEAKTRFALKVEWNKAIEENNRLAVRELQKEEYKHVGGSSIRNPHWYDAKK